MKTRRSPFHAPRRRLADTGGNNVCDAYPHDNIQQPQSRKHRNEDRRPKRSQP